MKQKIEYSEEGAFPTKAIISKPIKILDTKLMQKLYGYKYIEFQFNSITDELRIYLSVPSEIINLKTVIDKEPKKIEERLVKKINKAIPKLFKKATEKENKV